MASINGVSIKALRKFLGHEGETLYQGKLCIDGKKAGIWTQDSWGGPDSVHFDSREIESVFDKRAENYLAGFPDKDEARWRGAEFLFGDLLTLIFDEKEYKKLQKNAKGHVSLAVADDGYNVLMSGWDTSREHTRDEVLTLAMGSKGFRKDVLTEKWLDGTVVSARAYGSLADFDLAVDEGHPAPSWMYNSISCPYSVDLRDELRAAA